MDTTETPQIYTQLVMILNDIPAVPKTGHTTSGPSFDFRQIDYIRNVLHPLLAKHGVIVTPRWLDVTYSERLNQSNKTEYVVEANIEHIFWAEDGSSVSATTHGTGMDSRDKAANKAHTASEKLAYIEVFALETGDSMDPEADRSGDDSQSSSESPSDGQSPTQPRGRESGESTVQMEAMKSVVGQIERARETLGWSEDRLGAQKKATHPDLQHHDNLTHQQLGAVLKDMSKLVDQQAANADEQSDG